ncbi:MAG: HIT domain-containing protein [Byssovorax sp.]
MSNPLWAPWRMEYILGPKDRSRACIFCGIDGAPAEERGERLVVASNARAFVMLNRYPFAAGHIMVIPHAHVSALEDLDEETYDALFRLVRASAVRLKKALRAEGLNIGINLGASAGAGVAEHLHVHIVPRWPGDTNFMPVIADVRVVPQSLLATREHLAKHFADLDEQGALAPRDQTDGAAG